MQCHLCGQDEIVDHLLFQCSLARLIWQIVVCVLDLVRRPEGVDDLFASWIDLFPKSH